MPERCNKGPWPLRPDCITSDKWTLRGGEVDARTGIYGLIPNMYMEGIQTAISAKVGPPSTIIEIVPRSDDPDAYVCRRTDSPILEQTMCGACDLFRNHTLSPDGKDSGSYCKRSDDFHALLLHHLSRNGWTEEAKEKYLDEHTLIEDSKPIRGQNIQIRAVEDRHYIEWDCPFLGFRETLFPILIEGQLVATLFEGQITLHDEEYTERIKERTNTLLDRFPDCFDEFCTEKDCKKEDIHQELKECVATSTSEEHLDSPQHHNRDQPYSVVCTKDEYAKIIRDVHDELVKLEEMLETELGNQRRACVRTVVTNATKYIDRVVDSSNSAAECVKTAKEAMNAVMGFLKKNLSLRYAVMFASLAPFTETTLKPFAVSYSENDGLNKGLDQLRIDIENLPDDMTYQVVLPELDPSHLLDRLQGHGKSELGDHVLISIPLHLRSAAPPFFLFGLPKTYDLSAPENTPKDKELELCDNDFYGSLHPLFTLIGSFIASSIASSTAIIEGNELKYLSHEISQQCDGLDNIRLRYMTDPDELRNITDKTTEVLNRNMEAYLKQLRNIMEFAKKLARGESLVADKAPFYPFGETIGKWMQIFYMEREQKKIILNYPYPDGLKDPLRPAINADEGLFEMLLYNLLNNAEKYGYRGTRIHLDLSLETEDGESPKPDASYVLTITNYGVELDEDVDFFGPFEKTNKGEAGLGAGLYIARLIMEAHGGTIGFEPCKKISNYNVPLLGPAVRPKESPLKRKKEDLWKLKVEYDRLKSTGVYDHVVARKALRNSDGKIIIDEDTGKRNMITMYKPYKSAIRAEIDKPTYEVTIVAKFPQKEN